MEIAGLLATSNVAVA